MNRNASSADRNAQPRTPGRDPAARHTRKDNGDGRRGEEYRGAKSEDADNRDGGIRHRDEREPRRRLSGSAAAEYAKAHLLDLTAQPCEAVSSLSRSRDGWRVVLEVVELERIPHTTDILASYQIELDEDGELMGYERVRRYSRNDVNGE